MDPNLKAKDSILEVTEFDQYKAVDDLFEKSKPNSVYYTLLILSSFIISSGLLLENSTIVIGGMLVTPILTPILVVSLGLAVGELKPIKRVLILMIKSFATIIVGSFIMSLVFDQPKNIIVFDNTIRTAILYFVVALASGIAATFAWTRKDISDALPGVSIAVSLVPPLALIGIWASTFEFTIVRFYFFVFLFNLLGIIVGSLVVFSLLKFYRAKGELERKSTEVQQEQQQQ